MSSVVDEFESSEIKKRLVPDSEWFYIGTNQSLIIRETGTNNDLIRYYLPCYITENSCYYYCVCCKLATNNSRNVYAKVMDEATIAGCKVIVYDDSYHSTTCNLTLQQALEYDRLYINNIKNEYVNATDELELDDDDEYMDDDTNFDKNGHQNNQDKQVNEVVHVPIKTGDNNTSNTGIISVKQASLLNPRNWYFVTDDKNLLVIKISQEYGRYYEFLTGTEGLLYRCKHCYENKAPIDIIASVMTNNDGSYSLYAPHDSYHLDSCRPVKLQEQRKEKVHYKLAGNYVPVIDERWFFGYNNKNEPETVLFIRDADDYNNVRRFRIIKKISSDIRKVYRCSKCERCKIGIQAIAWTNTDPPKIEVMADPHYCSPYKYEDIVVSQKIKKSKYSTTIRRDPVVIELDSDMEDDDVVGTSSTTISDNNRNNESEWFFTEDDALVIKNSDDTFMGYKYVHHGDSPDGNGILYKCIGCKNKDTYAIFTKDDQVISPQKHDDVCQPIPVQIFKKRNESEEYNSDITVTSSSIKIVKFPKINKDDNNDDKTNNILKTLDSTCIQYFYNDKNELFRLFIGIDNVISDGHYYRFNDLINIDCAIFICEKCEKNKIYVIKNFTKNIIVKAEKNDEHECPTIS